MDESMDLLYRNAREYFTWPVGATDEDGVAVDLETVTIVFVPGRGSMRDGVTYPTATAAPVEGGKVRRLLAGPDAAAGADVVLPVGEHVPWFLVTDVPEVLPRPGRRIVVPH